MAYDSKTIDISYAWHTWNESNKGKNAGGVDYTFKNKDKQGKQAKSKKK